MERAHRGRRCDHFRYACKLGLEGIHTEFGQRRRARCRRTQLLNVIGLTEMMVTNAARFDTALSPDHISTRQLNLN
jgi:hypothetical protein